MGGKNECHVLSFCENDLNTKIDDIRRLLPDIYILGLFPRQTGIKLHSSRIKHLMYGNPLFLSRWESVAFARAITQALTRYNYDLVHLEGIQLALYLRLCQTKPTVFSIIDAVSRAYHQSSYVIRNPLKKWYRRFAAWRIKQLEYRTLNMATKVHVVSRVDCEYLRSNIPGLDVEHIEIVVPEELVNYKFENYKVERDNFSRITFTGLLSIEGIAEGLFRFLSEAYPTILKSCPDAQLVVLGQNAPSNIRKKLEGIPNVRYIAWAEDYYSELVKSKIIVMPDLSGTGIKNRVIQAMALAKPVVGTPFVFEGIPVENGIHCFKCETFTEFSRIIIRLLNDERLRREIGTSARQFVLNNYTMKEVIGPKWLNLYERAIYKFKNRDKRCEQENVL
jgi:glycosyltransferase involved in cell wall biosynthesis